MLNKRNLKHHLRYRCPARNNKNLKVFTTYRNLAGYSKPWLRIWKKRVIKQVKKAIPNFVVLYDLLRKKAGKNERIYTEFTTESTLHRELRRISSKYFHEKGATVVIEPSSIKGLGVYSDYFIIDQGIFYWVECLRNPDPKTLDRKMRLADFAPIWFVVPAPLGDLVHEYNSQPTLEVDVEDTSCVEYPHPSFKKELPGGSNISPKKQRDAASEVAMPSLNSPSSGHHSSAGIEWLGRSREPNA